MSGGIPQEPSRLLEQAAELRRTGRLQAAADLYAQVLRGQPDQPEALLNSGLIALATGAHRQAADLLARAVAVRPDDAASRNWLGLALAALGQFDAAVASYDAALAIDPGLTDVYVNRGSALARRGDLPAAIASFDRAIAADPDHFAAHFNRGVALADLRRFEEAIASYGQAIRIDPSAASVHYNKGVALFEVGRPEAAIESYGHAIALRPDHAASHFNRGVALADLKQYEAAVASFDRAIALRPGHVAALLNRGNALQQLRRFEAAIESYTQAIAAAESEAGNPPGGAARAAPSAGPAAAGSDRAPAQRGNLARAHSNRGCALHELNRLDEAAASFERALALDPGLADAHFNYGRTLQKLTRFAEAATAFERALAIDPGLPFAPGILLHTRMLCCDWRDFEPQREAITAAMRAGGQAADPFGWQAVSEDEANLLQCARIYAATFAAPHPPAPRAARPPRGDRVAIGYVCGEFRQQATTVLMCGVYEAHDRSRFALFGFDAGWDDGSEYRKRVERCFDRMVDIRGMSDADAARLIRDMGIDVLVNLNGYFGEARPGVFALRPSPIQVNYLGFPGTMGTGCFDYLIADRIVIPEASRPHYTEKIGYLPHSYQANDRARAIAGREFDRAEFGLPRDAVVYCCFNNTYKITPATFDAWMRILGRVEDSVLWLLDDNSWATANLLAEAERRGIGGSRLVFSPRLPLPEHLARHRLADLFLDTLPYNAHTTASDALWAGLPVLTQFGTTFPGRVGASLLLALGLPELVTHSAGDYETMAVELGRQPDRLRAVREKLASNRLSAPLFDTARFTRHLEAAYRTMFERYCAGLAPDHFAVTEDLHDPENAPGATGR